MGDFDGPVALVAGGGSGIGGSTAELPAVRGARVAVLDLAANDLPEDMFFAQADVTDDEGVRAAVVEHFGNLDAVVNNARIGARGDVTDSPQGIVKGLRPSGDAEPATAHLEQTADVSGAVREALKAAGPGARVCPLPEVPQPIPYVTGARR